MYNTKKIKNQSKDGWSNWIFEAIRLNHEKICVFLLIKQLIDLEFGNEACLLIKYAFFM